MTVDLLPRLWIGQPAGFDAVRLLRAGDALPVRVICMVDIGIARLSIMGQTLDVDTPFRLEDGTELTVTTSRDGNRLKLIVQTGIAEALPASENLADGIEAAFKVPPGFWAISARSAINKAWLSADLPQAAAEPNAMTRESLSLQPASNAELKLQERVFTRFNMDGVIDAPQEAVLLEAKSAAGMPWRGEAASSPVAAGSDLRLALDAAVNLGALVMIRMPNNTAPTFLKVAQDEQDDEPSEATAPASRAWIVEFSLDAGDLGLLAVNVKYSADSVSVKLRSGQEHAASRLLSVLPELKLVLESVDLTVETLSVEHGNQ